MGAGAEEPKKARGAGPRSDGSSRLLIMSAEYLLHLASDERNGVAGDDQLLVGRHDDHLDLTIRVANVNLFTLVSSKYVACPILIDISHRPSSIS